MSTDKATAKESKQDDAPWTVLWSAIITRWKDRHGGMDDNEISVMVALFRQWILERYWIEKDAMKNFGIAKAAMDSEGEFVDLEKEGKVQKCAENNSPVWDDERKRFFTRVLKLLMARHTYSSTDPVEKQKQIEEVKAVLRTGSMAGATCFCFEIEMNPRLFCCGGRA